MVSIRILCRNFGGLNPVCLDYQDLLSGKDLSSQILEAYCNNGLGLLTVKNIPGYLEKRQNLLPLAQKFALLSDQAKSELERPEASFAVGWSHGKERFEGEPDYSKGSYYANPEVDTPAVPGEWPNNVWPKESLPELEGAFKTLGQEMIRVGILLSLHLDRFIEARHKNYIPGTLSNIIKSHKSHVGRLLHYFPQPESDKNWCGWHNDHGALTALTSSMYLNQKTGEVVSANEIGDKKIGLFIKDRKGELCKVRAGSDELCFQIGETAQILSGGILKATPHAVFAQGLTNHVTRNTFAVFMEPRHNFDLVSIDSEKVFIEHPDVPSLRARWSPGMNFGEFHKKTIASFY